MSTDNPLISLVHQELEQMLHTNLPSPGKVVIL